MTEPGWHDYRQEANGRRCAKCGVLDHEPSARLGCTGLDENDIDTIQRRVELGSDAEVAEHAREDIRALLALIRWHQHLHADYREEWD